MAEHGWKWLKWPDMAGNGWNDWKCLQIAGKCWKWLDMTTNDWKWLNS